MSAARRHRSSVVALLIGLAAAQALPAEAGAGDAGTASSRKPALRSPMLYVLDCGTFRDAVKAPRWYD